MEITSATGFNGGCNAEGILAVANSITAVVNELIPGDPPFGDRQIQLIFSGSPRVSWGSDDYEADKYRIILSSQPAYWMQMAYQLSHELAHVKMGPARSNLLLEVFAVAVSQESLVRLQPEWKRQPPFSWHGWNEYADGLALYRQCAIQAEIEKLPTHVSDGFSEQSLEEQLGRIAGTRDCIEPLPLHHQASRTWQIVAADTLIRESLNTADRWADLLSLAVNTDPSALDEPTFRDNLRLCGEKLPAWLPEWLR